MFKKALAEFIGTFTLVFVACGVAALTGGSLVATSLAFGLTIVAMAYSRLVLGAHFLSDVTAGFAVGFVTFAVARYVYFDKVRAVVTAILEVNGTESSVSEEAQSTEPAEEPASKNNEETADPAETIETATDGTEKPEEGN